MDKVPARDARGREFDTRSRHPKMSIFVSHLFRTNMSITVKKTVAF